MNYSLGIVSCESLLYDSLFSAPKRHCNSLPLPVATGFLRPTNLVIFQRQNITALMRIASADTVIFQRQNITTYGTDPIFPADQTVLATIFGVSNFRSLTFRYTVILMTAIFGIPDFLSPNLRYTVIVALCWNAGF